MQKLEIVKFIEKNKNWEELLSQDPYCLKIKKDSYNRVIFNYNQISSKEDVEINKEARGLILKIKEEDIRVVCLPLYRFFNYGQGTAAEIDWTTAIGQEKLDGSIIKIWHDIEWNISTNGMIDARESNIVSNTLYKNYYELVIAALNLENDFIGFDNLNKNYTYIFEICSPFNKIVADYDLSIYHLATRNNLTLEEIKVDIGVRKPKEYKMESLEDYIAATKQMPFNEEGYVVVDKNFNRIKVKNPVYLIAHRLKGNNTVPTELELVELVLTCEYGEFLSYFPEYKPLIEDIINKIAKVDDYVKDFTQYCVNETRKDIALTLEKSFLKEYILRFIFGSNKELTFLEYLQSCRLKKALNILKNIGF